MLHDLTRIAGHKRLRAVKTYALEGEKFGVMRERGSIIYVPPEVHALLQTDYEATAKVLRVHVLKKNETLSEFLDAGKRREWGDSHERVLS